ncbi:hypothetical protein BU17DRAFT_97229 [Hysterangium stoloniferum]|nr:hypothetical protein BU17DRAFT_97229 [Hysterangium stoloniferum]
MQICHHYNLFGGAPQALNVQLAPAGGAVQPVLGSAAVAALYAQYTTLPQLQHHHPPGNTAAQQQPPPIFQWESPQHYHPPGNPAPQYQQPP